LISTRRSDTGRIVPAMRKAVLIVRLALTGCGTTATGNELGGVMP
jgi:hypothetical protein